MRRGTRKTRDGHENERKREREIQEKKREGTHECNMAARDSIWSGHTTPNYHLAKSHYAKYHLVKCNYAKLITPNATTPNAIAPKRERYVRQYSNNSETLIVNNIRTYEYIQPSYIKYSSI